MTNLSRRNFIAGAAGLATILAFGDKSMAKGKPIPSTVFYPYEPGSFYKSTTTGLVVNSDLTTQFKAFMASRAEQADWPYPSLNGVLGNQWGMPYVESASSDPLWTLTGNIPPAVQPLASQGFHAPDWFGDQITGTSDSPFVVCDKAFHESIWGWGASVVGTRQLSVKDCGIFLHASNGLDKRDPLSDSTVNYRTRGCIPDCMVIRRSAMDVAIAKNTGLGYVLHFLICESLTSAGWVHPLVNCEQNKFGWGAEGTRIGIDPSIDLSTRGMSQTGLAIARTLQTNGMIIGDNSGGASALKVEQATATYNPWAGTDMSHHGLAGITWDDFVVYAS